MAKVKQIALCPQISCGAELPYPVPERCPECGKVITPPDNPHFGSPDFLTFQMDDYRQQYDEDVRGPDAKPLSPAEKKLYEEIQEALTKWARECPTADKLAALSDAHIVIRQVLYSRIDGDALKAVVVLGKQIGSIAKAVDDFIQSGGALYERETRPVSPIERSDGVSQTATRGGGDPDGDNP